MSSGTTASMSASRVGKPSVSSISRTSGARGPMCRAAKWVWRAETSGSSPRPSVGRRGGAGVAVVIRGRAPAGGGPPASLFADVRAVGCGVQKALERARVAHAELDHPSVAVRVAIHDRGIGIERTVRLYDLAGDRRVELG